MKKNKLIIWRDGVAYDHNGKIRRYYGSHYYGKGIGFK